MAYKRNPDELPPLVIAYNCGRPWQGDKPDMRFVGTGEGAGVLGAGVYFATDEDVADRYLKFGGAKHKVTIDTRGLLDVRGTTQEAQAARAALMEVLEDAVVENNAERRVQRDKEGYIWHINGHSPTDHGKGYAGYIFMLLGPEEGRRRIIESGVTGMYEKLPDGYEIAVYDPSIVTLVERTVPGYRRNPRLYEYQGGHLPPDPDNGAPMHDVDNMMPDYCAHPDWYFTGIRGQLDYEAASIICAARGRPWASIWVYRAVPPGVKEINPGDWVTQVRAYAVEHLESNLGGVGRILKAKVRAGSLFTEGNSHFEWGWWPDAEREREFERMLRERRAMLAR